MACGKFERKPGDLAMDAAIEVQQRFIRMKIWPKVSKVDWDAVLNAVVIESGVPKNEIVIRLKNIGASVPTA